jgi:hypothetical protein
MSPISSESPVEGEISMSKQEVFDEKSGITVLAGKDGNTVTADDVADDNDGDSGNAIIITGADAAIHLLPLRDDFDPVLTFRSIVLASGLACFQAVMNQIYQVSFAFPKTVVRPLCLYLTHTLLVQTYLGHDPGNLHCPHLLLCW